VPTDVFGGHIASIFRFEDKSGTNLKIDSKQTELTFTGFSGQISWLEIQRPGFDSGRYQILTQPHEYNRGTTWKKK
jgi:hypothetical protein